VLGHRRNSAAPESGNEGCSKTSDAIGITTECPRSNHGVARLHSKIGDRREIDIRADRAQFASDTIGNPFDKRDVIDRSKCHGRGDPLRKAGRMSDPPSLLIDRDDRRVPGNCTQKALNEGTRSLNVRDIPIEENNPARSKVHEFVQQRLVRIGIRKTDAEQSSNGSP
jgi:hypothetical protein